MALLHWLLCIDLARVCACTWKLTEFSDPRLDHMIHLTQIRLTHLLHLKYANANLGQFVYIILVSSIGHVGRGLSAGKEC